MERTNVTFDFTPGKQLFHIEGYNYDFRLLKDVQIIGGRWIADGKEVSVEELISLGYAEKVI